MKKIVAGLSVAFVVVLFVFAASNYKEFTPTALADDLSCNDRAVIAIYKQILERDPTTSDPNFKDWSREISAGKMSAREATRQIARSDEYKMKFVQGKSPDEAVSLLYRHLLNRDADAEGLSNWVKVLKSQGLAAVVNGLVDSQEYAQKFGERVVPGSSGLRACGDGGCELSNHAFARGYCAVSQCPNGQWSRGSVKVSDDGTVYVRQGLETDRVDYGISGWVEFEFKDAGNKTIAYGYTKQQSIPAKAPGKARIVDFPAETQKISTDVVRKIIKVEVSAKCGGDNFSPFGMTVGEMAETVKIIMGSSKNQ